MSEGVSFIVFVMAKGTDVRVLSPSLFQVSHSVIKIQSFPEKLYERRDDQLLMYFRLLGNLGISISQKHLQTASLPHMPEA